MPPAFRILGPLEVTLDERPVSLGGGRERAILAVLLLNIGEVVSVERLIDGVWGEARPASAKHMIHEYVSRLRQTLDEGTTIATRPPGYLLEPADETLDARQFAQFTAAARSAAREERHDDALSAYQQGLALWRGETLADIGLEGDALIAATRLDQERRLVDEERVDCALALGQHLQLIPELEHRVQQEPLRERSRAQLMLALYRAGRQTEALDSYRQGRALLVDQAGVEPGRELRELERAILTHDSALELGTVRPGRPERSTAPVHHRRAWVVASISVLALAIAAIVFVVARSGSGHTLAQIDASSAAAIDPGTNRLVSEVPVGNGPGRVVAGFKSVWVVNNFDSTVSRINLTTGNVQTIPVDGDPTAIAIGAGFVWVACTGTRRLLEINPEIDLVVKRIPVGNGPSGIAVSPGSVWVTNRLDDSVTRIDSTSGKAIRTFEAGASPSDIVYGFGSLWITNETSASVSRLDPVTGGLRNVTVGNGPEAVAVGFRAVWVANSLDESISRVDPSRNIQTDEIPVGQGPSSVLASDHAIWVADSYGGKIVRIDPRRTDDVHTIAVGNGPQSLASIDGRIWFSSRQTARVHRGGTLRLYEIEAPDSLDQDAAYLNTAWSVSAMTGDGLVGFKRVGGLDGVTLVPDLATSLPLPTNGGRTYTFQLLPGIRYSNGDLVRASDVRRALERDVRVNSPGPAFANDLVGGELIGGRCWRSHCDLSRGVATDDRAGTVTLHLRKPDPELFYKLALPYAYPVPREVSMTRPSRLGVPGTGPYEIQRYEGSRLVLVRNRRFRQWSATAQPDGRPDRIEATYNDALDAQLTAVEHGRADFMESPLPPSRLDEITTRYAAQTHVFPAAKTFAVFLNAKVAPFDSLDARRAFNYAIDRAKAIEGFGGTDEAAVTCQILPAGMPGYRPYCPYTRHSTRSGLWVGPDLQYARKLVGESGTRGERVIFWTGPLPLERIIGRLAVATLRQLGYRASLNIVPDTCDGPPVICDTARDQGYFGEVNDSRTHAQAGFDAWVPDYPAASNFLSFFACSAFEPANQNNVNTAEICNSGIDRAVRQALAHQTIDAPGASGTRWAAVDRLVTDLGPWAPVVNARDAVVVSRRVGNLQSNPQWGVLFDQIWVR